jgi:hypothetical protein
MSPRAKRRLEWVAGLGNWGVLLKEQQEDTERTLAEETWSGEFPKRHLAA